VLHYDDWPYKILYASAEISANSLMRHLEAFYEANPSIPHTRRPHIIHVAGITRSPDLQGILLVLHSLQQYAQASTEISFSYGELVNEVLKHA